MATNSRNRKGESRETADRRAHFQPHARDPRRHQAALFLPLGGLSGRHAGARNPQAKGPEASENLSREVVAFVQRLRKMDLFKLPGVAETIDWSKALVALDKMTLDPQTV